MKPQDISDTPLVRRYGARGARIFARFWFSSLYVYLTALTALLWILGPESPGGWRRIFMGCLAGGLSVFATSLVTRMRLGYLAAIERLEVEERKA